MTDLGYDAAGNLTTKGDLRFHYDYRTRLVRVSKLAIGEIARYEYDTFNRRITKTVEDVETQTVWSGWRPVEDYKDGLIRARRTYGLGLDEIVRMQLDLDGDTALDDTYHPLYDGSGNPVVLTGELGRPIERYEYTPFGPKRIRVDSVSPQLAQARVEDNRLVLEWNEGLREGQADRGSSQWLRSAQAEWIRADARRFPGPSRADSVGASDGSRECKSV